MDYIEINGYKSIKSAKIDIAPINILIGANGSGKSNFVSFFELLHRLCGRVLSEYVALKGGEDKILFQGRKATEKFSFHIEFDGGQNGYAAELTAGDDGFVFTHEQLYYKGKPKDITHHGKEANLSLTDNHRAPYILGYMAKFRKYHFHDTSANSPFTKYSNTSTDTAFLYANGGNLAAFLYKIRNEQPLVYNRIVACIKSVAPYFSDFYLEPNEENNLRLLWQDKFSDITYGATDLSDGTLRFIALATLFLQPNLPATIIIDEPELGLHPFAIAKLAGMIKSASKRNCQVIVATQSADLIAHFEPSDIITVDQVGGETHFTRQSEEMLKAWLEENYTIDELWKRNMIQGGQPNYEV